MTNEKLSSLLNAMIGQPVVLDLRSQFVCLGTLTGLDDEFYDVADADMHDLRDSTATREIYAYDSKRVGIRRNRARVLIRRDEVVAVSLFKDISER
jgi:small nuclear ribonucleoprotein (snRNP)-like protein